MLKQKGVILFFTLTLLIVITVITLTLMKEGQASHWLTSNIIDHNSAVSATSYGVNAATQWLQSQQQTGNLAISNPQEGYFAFTQNPTANQKWMDFWESSLMGQAKQVAFLTSGAVSPLGTELKTLSGNEVFYIIHRLCINEGDPNAPETKCLVPTQENSQKTQGNSQVSGNISLTKQKQIYYRITIMSRGTRETTALTQAVIAL